MKALKLAVAEPSAILRYGIVALLRRMPAANVDILEIGDISQLAAQLSRHRPDVLIVNPASLGLCTPPQLRAQTGCEGMRCVALQLAMTDAATLGLLPSELLLRGKWSGRVRIRCRNSLQKISSSHICLDKKNRRFC